MDKPNGSKPADGLSPIHLRPDLDPNLFHAIPLLGLHRFPAWRELILDFH